MSKNESDDKIKLLEADMSDLHMIMSDLQQQTVRQGEGLDHLHLHISNAEGDTKTGTQHLQAKAEERENNRYWGIAIGVGLGVMTAIASIATVAMVKSGIRKE
ncbi:MAG: hypothetical protein ACMG6E_09100 [Candidatus Roizmanbacteria bacterium]